MTGHNDYPLQKWEYKVFTYNDSLQPPKLSLQEHLNCFGVEGWELVSDSGDRWIFKRPKRPDSPEIVEDSFRHPEDLEIDDEEISARFSEDLPRFDDEY